MAARPRTARSARVHRWQFEERHSWERGFATYYREWVAPEVARLESSQAAGERRYRRRLPVLLGAGIFLTLLVAEASGSLPITLFWAVLLLLIGGGLARAPLAVAREHALNAVRDRVVGFFGLRPLSTRKVLQAELRASGLLKGRTARHWAEQYWGIHCGLPVRLARLSLSSPQPLGQGRNSTASTPIWRGFLANSRPDPDHSPNATVLLVETKRPWPFPFRRHHERQALAAGAIEPRSRGTNDPSAVEASEPAGIDLLSAALDGAAFDVACYGDRLLVLVYRDLPAFGWSARGEEADSGPDLVSIDGLTRALLKSLHELLSAAHVLAGDDAVSQYRIPPRVS